MQRTVPTSSFCRRILVKRWLIKGLLFTSLAAVVLNPNLKRAYLQIRHVLNPEALVQTDFPGLRSINSQLDRMVAADRGKHSEARLVARFVLKKIKYVSDYETWGNLDYWPTAREVWQKRQEDCDGRAVLATSILRARGFNSARMVVGLDHMWIIVDENEKDDSKPRHLVALLNPNPNFSLELHDRSRAGDLFRIVQAFLHPTALRETSTELLADIPVLRKVLLISVLLVLCYHPCKNPTGLLLVLTAGLAGVKVLGDWHPGSGHMLQVTLASALLLLAFAAALLMNWFKRMPALPAC